jgi:histidine ammonia-lyase
VSETKVMAAPHSVDSIPTSGNQEDYVSMGMSASRRLSPMLENLRNIVAIELLAACQGIEFHAPHRTGPEAQKAHNLVRAVSKSLDADRSLSPDIAAVSAVIAKGNLGKILDKLNSDGWEQYT